MIVLGYALFPLTPYRELKWRVFLYSSIGGALCGCEFLFLWLPGDRVCFLPSWAVCCSSSHSRRAAPARALCRALANQQRLLRGVVAAVPQADAAVPVVVESMKPAVIATTGRWEPVIAHVPVCSTSIRIYDLRFVLCAIRGKPPIRAAAGTARAVPLLSQRHRDFQDDQPFASYPYGEIVILAPHRRRNDASDHYPDRLPASGRHGARYAPQKPARLDCAPPRPLRDALLACRWPISRRIRVF